MNFFPGIRAFFSQKSSALRFEELSFAFFEHLIVFFKIHSEEKENFFTWNMDSTRRSQSIYFAENFPLFKKKKKQRLRKKGPPGVCLRLSCVWNLHGGESSSLFRLSWFLSFSCIVDCCTSTLKVRNSPRDGLPCVINSRAIWFNMKAFSFFEFLKKFLVWMLPVMIIFWVTKFTGP